MVRKNATAEKIERCERERNNRADEPSPGDRYAFHRIGIHATLVQDHASTPKSAVTGTSPRSHFPHQSIGARSARPYGETVVVSAGIGASLSVSRAPRGASVVETAEVSVALVASSTRSEFPRVTASSPGPQALSNSSDRMMIARMPGVKCKKHVPCVVGAHSVRPVSSWMGGQSHHRPREYGAHAVRPYDPALAASVQGES
jgi:hypothetical protein